MKKNYSFIIVVIVFMATLMGCGSNHSFEKEAQVSGESLIPSSIEEPALPPGINVSWFKGDYDNVIGFGKSGLSRAEKNGKWGFINKSGAEVIPFIYSGANGFVNGLAPVCKDDKWGYIDTQGKVVIPFKYDEAGVFKDGLAEVTKGKYQDSKSGFIDTTGKEVIPVMYRGCNWGFSEGLAGVCVEGYLKGKYGYIDTTGEVVIPFIYDYVNDFSEGLAGVELGGMCGYIDKTGQVVIPITLERREWFHEGMVKDSQDLKNWGFIDRNGENVIPYIYEWVDDFSEGLALVWKDEKCGFIDKEGKVVIPFIYDRAGGFSEGLAVISVVTGYETRKMPGVSENYSGDEDDFVEIEEKIYKKGYIDKTGKEVIPCIFDEARHFRGGEAIVCKDGKWGILK